MVSQEQFADAIEKFLSETGMSATAFGRDAVGDPTLVFEIRRGRSCSLKVAERIAEFMNRSAADARDADHPHEAA